MEKSQEVLHAFLDAWKTQDCEQMFEHSQITWKNGRSKDDIRALFAVPRLKGYKVVSFTNISSTAARYAVELTMESGDKAIVSVNVICEAAIYKPATYGTWGVNPISVLNVVQHIPREKPAAKAKAVKTVPAKKPAPKKQASKSAK